MEMTDEQNQSSASPKSESLKNSVPVPSIINKKSLKQKNLVAPGDDKNLVDGLDLNELI